MPTPPSIHDQTAVPERRLTLVDCTSIIVGIIIGASIYRATPLIASNVASPLWLIAVWVLGGLVALVGSLCYAELASTYPHEGGDYFFLKRAYGTVAGFLFAWMEFWVIRPGSVGAMAFVFAEYAHELAPLPAITSDAASKFVYAVASILGLSAVNMFGFRSSVWTQNVLSGVKVVGLLAIIVAGLVWIPMTRSTPKSDAPVIAAGSTSGDDVNASAPAVVESKGDDLDANEAEKNGGDAKDVETIDETIGDASSTSYGGVDWMAFRLAMILVLFTYGGWNDISYVAAEVKQPERNVLRSLLLGTTLVAVIYLLTNLAFLSGLGWDGFRRANAVAAELLSAAMGSVGGKVVSLLICVSSLGAIHGMLLTGGRIYYALGADHRLFAFLGRWNARRGTPLRALAAQLVATVGLVAVVGAAEDGFDRLVAVAAPFFWLFILLVGISLFVLRWRDATIPRAFRVPLFPWTPILFCASTGFMLHAGVTYAIATAYREAYWAIGAAALGLLIGAGSWLAGMRQGVSIAPDSPE